jgi:peptidoglycan/LPS O-acetylase OafA/YrhL
MVLYRNYQPDHVVSHIGYVARNAVMFVHGVDYDIKGIFEEMRSSAINGPLWSLPYEFWLYVALFILFTAGVFWLRIVGVMLAFVACLAISFLTATDLPVLHLSTDQLGRLGSFFFAGAIVAFAWPYILWRKSFVVFATIALLAATTFLPLTVSEVAMPFAFALIALCVSPLMAWFALAGDASYGIYVFGWPVQQLAIKSVGSFWVSLAVSLVVSTCVGYATWHLFEKRCTKQRSRLSRFLSSIRTTAPARDEPSHTL